MDRELDDITGLENRRYLPLESISGPDLHRTQTQLSF